MALYASPELFLPVAYHEIFDLSWGNDVYPSQNLGRCLSTVPEKDGFQNKGFKLEDRFNDSYVLSLISAASCSQYSAILDCHKKDLVSARDLPTGNSY